MRPLFYDYPEDTKVWEIEDEYMFGPDMLVAPILYEDMRERTLYLPEGDWVDINSKTEYKGGYFVTVAAPLDAHCNGDMHAALDYAAKIKHAQKDFLTSQGIHAIID